MTDSGKFGSPRVLQFGDRTAGNQPGDSGHCAQCEAMLADALDGALTAEQQAFFDLHMQHCGPCAQLLADATRGAAWLEMLRSPAPEPAAELLQRILTQTGPLSEGSAAAFSVAAPVPGYLPAFAGTAHPVHSAQILPFGRRTVAAVRHSSLGQILMQPRLVMTAAMAFFSIALTMNLTGFNPLSLRASDVAPGSLKRDFFAANTRVVRYYEGLRVVYELESRVHELQSATGDDTPSATETTDPVPANQPEPGNEAPAAQPLTPAPQPAPRKQHPPAHSRGNAGNNRHGLRHTQTQIAALVGPKTLSPRPIEVRTGRTTV